MTTLSDEELQRMRFDLESDLVERKPSASERSKIRRNICAFANDLSGRGHAGVILIGVNDDGSCASLEITDELLRKLTDMRDDGNILPIPSIRTVGRNKSRKRRRSGIRTAPGRHQDGFAPEQRCACSGLPATKNL